MSKKASRKINNTFLKKDYPVNILMVKLSNKRSKQLVQERTKHISLQKRIKKAEQQIIKRNLFKYTTSLKTVEYKIANNFFLLDELYSRKHTISVYFLYPLDQFKSDLTRQRLQYKPSSNFLQQLKERKKISIIYGTISKNFFQKIYTKALKSRGKITENISTMLERRIDVILQRICFFKTIMAARQAISHKFISVNGKIINTPSYLVKPADIISLIPQKRKTLQNQMLNFVKTKVYKRRSRYLLSPSFIIDYLNSNKYGNHKKSPTLPYNEKKLSFMDQRGGILKSLERGVKSIDGRVLLERSSLIKKKGFLLFSENKKTNLLKKGQDKIFHARINKICYKVKSRRHRIAAMQISPMKPINIEISYKTLTAIYLYSPQKIAYPCLIDYELAYSSLR